VTALRPSDRTLRALAWGIFTLCLLLAAAALGIERLGAGQLFPSEFGSQTERAVETFLILAFPLVGALIVSHRTRNLVGWLLLVPPAFLVLATVGQMYSIHALIIDPGSLPFGAGVSWAIGSIWIATLPVLPLLLLVYPSGTLLSPRWRLLGWAPVVVGLGVALVVTIFTWPYRGRELLVSLDELGPELRWESLLILSYLEFIVASAALALVSLVLRYRRSAREGRLQIKWLAVAVALLVVDGVASIAFPSDEAWRSIVSDIVFASIPLAIGIAIFRYRLYEIDRIINRTLVYIPLVAIIGGFATAMIPLSQRVFMAVTGNKSDAAIVLTTLLVASLVTPLRKRLEAAVEGRFKPKDHAAAMVTGNGPAEELNGPAVAAQLRSLADRIDALERRSQSGPGGAGR
jgi:hypothetical protein